MARAEVEAMLLQNGKQALPVVWVPPRRVDDYRRQGFKTLDSIFPPGSEGRPPNWKPEPPKTPPLPPGGTASTHGVAPLSTSDHAAQGKGGKGLHDFHSDLGCICAMERSA